MDSANSQSDSKAVLLVGHRGTGACKELDIYRSRCLEQNSQPPEKIRENTLKAMKATHEAGGHYVEFDVQLSKDEKVVVYHDFYIPDGRFVGDLTLEQLQKLNEDKDSREQHMFPTIDEFFTELPEELGFDIEIKYPRFQISDGMSVCPEFTWDMQVYVSKIVSVVKKLSEESKRQIFYSCFVSEVCKLLHKLDPGCSVVFLSGSQNALELSEECGHSADNALQFAISAGLYGVGVNAKDLISDAEAGHKFVQSCHSAGLRCFTWGLDNNHRINRCLQRDWNIDGLIFDNIHADEFHF